MVMEHTLGLGAIVALIALMASVYPLLGLVAMALASVYWCGLAGGLVITLFWVRYGASPLLVGWWPAKSAT